MTTFVEEARRAARIQPSPRVEEFPDTFAPGRRCVSDGCITILNRYNEGPLCLLHAQRVESIMLAATEGLF